MFACWLVGLFVRLCLLWRSNYSFTHKRSPGPKKNVENRGRAPENNISVLVIIAKIYSPNFTGQECYRFSQLVLERFH